MNITKKQIDDLSVHSDRIRSAERLRRESKKSLNDTRRKIGDQGIQKRNGAYGIVQKMYGRSVLLTG
jgi:hypothetical protein